MLIICACLITPWFCSVHLNGKFLQHLYTVFKIGWTIKAHKKLARVWRHRAKYYGFLRFYHPSFSLQIRMICILASILWNYFLLILWLQAGHFVFIDNPSSFHSTVFYACRRFLSSEPDKESLPEGIISAWLSSPNVMDTQSKERPIYGFYINFFKN